MAKQVKASAPRDMTGAKVSVSNGLAFSVDLAVKVATGLHECMSETRGLEEAALISRNRQLPFMVATLEGVAPVTAKQWAASAPSAFAAWATAQGCTIVDGKAMRDGKVSAYASTSFSLVKVAVIALTNGIAVGKDKAGKPETLGAYVMRVRPICASRGLIEARAASKEPKETKVSATGPNKVLAAALVVTAKDDALAHAFAFIAADAAAKERFKAWWAKYVAARDALAALDA